MRWMKKTNIIFRWFKIFEFCFYSSSFDLEKTLKTNIFMF